MAVQRFISNMSILRLVQQYGAQTHFTRSNYNYARQKHLHG